MPRHLPMLLGFLCVTSFSQPATPPWSCFRPTVTFNGNLNKEESTELLQSKSIALDAFSQSTDEFTIIIE